MRGREFQVEGAAFAESRVKSKLVHLGSACNPELGKESGTLAPWGLGAAWAAWSKALGSHLSADAPGWGGKKGCRQMCIFPKLAV